MNGLSDILNKFVTRSRIFISSEKNGCEKSLKRLRPRYCSIKYNLVRKNQFPKTTMKKTPLPFTCPKSKIEIPKQYEKSFQS